MKSENNMPRNRSLWLWTAICILTGLMSTQAFAWDSPKTAVEEFVKLDLLGGRLSSEQWSTYIDQYVYAPKEYDEPGWDMATIVTAYRIGKPACENNLCRVKVKYTLFPTKNLHDTSIARHERGGRETLEFRVRNTAGNWKIEPQGEHPRISIETYHKSRN
ncbi:MAG TPA: hypothetical protein VGE55_11110 [Limnobacter sp.]|uniref:hypothetical protein n=1 Tax=Limnobacter sp. TaxID=2003368 RepID=UPI002EDADD84